jgi:hypothetical protein
MHCCLSTFWPSVTTIHLFGTEQWVATPFRQLQKDLESLKTAILDDIVEARCHGNRPYSSYQIFLKNSLDTQLSDDIANARVYLISALL